MGGSYSSCEYSEDLVGILGAAYPWPSQPLHGLARGRAVTFMGLPSCFCLHTDKWWLQGDGLLRWFPVLSHSIGTTIARGRDSVSIFMTGEPLAKYSGGLELRAALSWAAMFLMHERRVLDSRVPPSSSVSKKPWAPGQAFHPDAGGHRFWNRCSSCVWEQPHFPGPVVRAHAVILLGDCVSAQRRCLWVRPQGSPWPDHRGPWLCCNTRKAWSRAVTQFTFLSKHLILLSWGEGSRPHKPVACGHVLWVWATPWPQQAVSRSHHHPEALSYHPEGLVSRSLSDCISWLSWCLFKTSPHPGLFLGDEGRQGLELACRASLHDQPSWDLPCSPLSPGNRGAMSTSLQSRV